MNRRDRNLVLSALTGRLPPNWRAYAVESGAPLGVVVLPPTGMARQGAVLPWPGPGPRPKGLELVRLLATFNPVQAPNRRAVLCVGLPGDRKMRALGKGYQGRGWPRAVADQLVAAAEAVHRGEKP